MELEAPSRPSVMPIQPRDSSFPKTTLGNSEQRFWSILASILVNVIYYSIFLSLIVLLLLSIIIGSLFMDPTTCTSSPALSTVLLVDGLCNALSVGFLWSKAGQNGLCGKTTVGFTHFGGFVANVVLSVYTYSLYGHVNFCRKSAGIKDYCNQTLFTFAIAFTITYWIIGICYCSYLSCTLSCTTSKTPRGARVMQLTSLRPEDFYSPTTNLHNPAVMRQPKTPLARSQKRQTSGDEEETV